MKIIFSGGYTLGPVTPLLAIFEIIKKKHPETEFLWIGTKTGPEKVLIENSGIKFVAIDSGKFRRYFSLWNLFDIFKIIKGIFFFSACLIANCKSGSSFAFFSTKITNLSASYIMCLYLS